ncbi:MAG: glutaredoxin 3 [Candidatus Competibacteraceae bacterium]|nr:glutaredoxin 3 [Candidatus Competibacteraceae bacterium]MBK7983928.1 glutaredoxin 3 [Candidatus Competibacteraceae bacterium]MBK8897530.1 glutaredoxin 3 [Candidatus Competibacteraceae bacterium]MBK8963682.1 glutaredoxin 3 [Candidatus Competibacteraceae bacterium]MBK9950572.1 glutaredoxin 3 [Candidatus Competibacteraceae bacterium]
MPDIIVYSSPFCPYCRRARALLDSKGVRYTVLDVGQNPQLWDEIAQRTGRDTVPQIFIGGRHVGGCDELFALDRRGELEPLLND